MTMAVSDENQNQFINDLIENKPKIILFDTEESLLDVRLHDTKNRLQMIHRQYLTFILLKTFYYESTR